MSGRRRGHTARWLADVLTSEISRIGGRERVCLVHVRRSWRSIVGEELARHTNPEALRNGTLSIAVRDHVWLHQLAYFRTDITRGLQQETDGTVAQVFFRVGPLHSEAGGGDSAAPSVHDAEQARGDPAESLDEALRRVAQASAFRLRKLDPHSGTEGTGGDRPEQPSAPP